MPYGLNPSTAVDSLTGRGLAVSTNQVNRGLGGNASVPIDLRALTLEAFGYSGLRRYQLPAGGEQQGVAGFYPTPDNMGQSFDGRTNMFGLPVFVAVNFGAVGGNATRRDFYGLTLLDPLVSVDEPFNIITTPITGRKGTVKEYIGKDDYAVTIRGILATSITVENRFAYPLAEVQEMEQLANLGVAVPVSGWLQDVYGINSLVIRNARYESLNGFVNLQAFELECLSDDPIELTI